MSLNDALPLLIKKFACFSDMHASPNLVCKGTDSLINSHTFYLFDRLDF